MVSYPRNVFFKYEFFSPLNVVMGVAYLCLKYALVLITTSHLCILLNNYYKNMRSYSLMKCSVVHLAKFLTLSVGPGIFDISQK